MIGDTYRTCAQRCTGDMERRPSLCQHGVFLHLCFAGAFSAVNAFTFARCLLLNAIAVPYCHSDMLRVCVVACCIYRVYGAAGTLTVCLFSAAQFSWRCAVLLAIPRCYRLFTAACIHGMFPIYSVGFARTAGRRYPTYLLPSHRADSMAWPLLHAACCLLFCCRRTRMLGRAPGDPHRTGMALLCALLRAWRTWLRQASLNAAATLRGYAALCKTRGIAGRRNLHLLRMRQDGGAGCCHS